MRRLFWLILCVLPTVGTAQDWQRLDGAGIQRALEGRAMSYASGAHQTFHASGRTLYHTGRVSWGYWRVQGDQYCSQWPPSDLWGCYDLLASADGMAVRFVSAHGDTSDGIYTD